MKLIALNIYGFGQFENVKIDNLADFQVFFGENEAGKTTIMSFITAVLFGFPTKQQSEIRYEPKHSSKYGGSIRIYHEQYGFATIERVKGKASGDVNVVLDNGTAGSEELLKELLANFDKSLFQAIFSFNLHGLQNIHQMKGEELGRFLFSAGTLGTEQLSKTEAFLQRELNSRFKPGGKKPILNEKLQELHEISRELKKAAAKSAEYESFIADRDRMLEELAQVNSRLKEIRQEVEKCNEWKKIEPIVKAEKWTKKELEELGEVEFPVRGVERLENLNLLILPHKTAITSIRERIDQIKQEIAGMQPDQGILEYELEISALLDQIPLYEQMNIEKRRLETKLAGLEEKLSVINERLHLPLTEDEIFSINTNIVVENNVEMLSRKSRKLTEQKEDLEKIFKEETNELSQIEKQISNIENLCLSKQDRAHLEQQVRIGNDVKGLERELKNVKDKMEFYNDSITRDQAAKGRLKFQFLFFGTLLAGLIVYAFIFKDWILFGLGAAGLLAAAVFTIFSYKQFKKGKAVLLLNELKEKEKQLIRDLQSIQAVDMTKLEEQLQRDNRLLEELQILGLKLEQQQSQVEKIIAKFEEWEKESSGIQRDLQVIARELRIPENMAQIFLDEAFQQIEGYKAVYREKRQMLTELEQIKEQQVNILIRLEKFTKLFLTEKRLDLHKAAESLRIRLKEEHEKQIKCQEKGAQLSELEEELQQKSGELELLMEECQKLIKGAKVITEQEFYELGEKAEQQRKLREQYDGLQNQLQYSLLSEQERNHFLQLHSIEELIAGYNHEMQSLQEKGETLQEKIASIRYEIQVLEDGGIYSEILHHYKQKKFELEEAAKEWAVFTLAQDILLSTIHKYKNEHLPRMLSKAEEFLSFLTHGSYQRIHPHPQGTGFLVERKDHAIFEANELSQATTEQLYVSIRLALATTIYEKFPFPIIIDDSFVNFDAGRAQKVISLLKQLKHNQILFFTCHSHLLSNFHNNNVLYLTKGAGQIIS